MATVKYWQAINSAMHEEMARDSTVCVIGEDVGAPGGPFGATKGLQVAFGDKRVRDTPISEAVIVGAAVGAAMTGLRPIVEVMFIDFMGVAMDQVVNQAAKVAYMSAGAYHAPMVIRTVCASGRSTGPQHSQNLEAWLAHVPGLKVVWGTTPGDAKGLLKAAIRDDNPVIVIESLELWSERGDVDDDPEAIVPIGQAAIRREGDDVTVVTWGGAVRRVLAAAETVPAEIGVEVIDLRTISPWDRQSVLGSVRKTGRLIVVHDAVGEFGAGAEIAATVADECFDHLLAPIKRLAAPFAPSPAPPHLERAYLPQPKEIAAAICETARRHR